MSRCILASILAGAAVVGAVFLYRHRVANRPVRVRLP